MTLIAIVFIPCLDRSSFSSICPPSSAGLAKHQKMLSRFAQVRGFLVLVVTVGGGLVACLIDRMSLFDNIGQQKDANLHLT